MTRNRHTPLVSIRRAGLAALCAATVLCIAVGAKVGAAVQANPTAAFAALPFLLPIVALLAIGSCLIEAEPARTSRRRRNRRAV